MRKAVKIVISVGARHAGFRFYALRKGKEMGVRGTIAYLSHQTGVVIHAEANQHILQKYIHILRQGTPFCEVVSVLSVPDKVLNCKYFEIVQSVKLPGQTQLNAKPRKSLRFGIFGF